MIEIKKLTKYFSLPDSSKLGIFEGLDISISSWQFVAVMWQSGQGKTTLLNILAGIDRDFIWEVHVLWKHLWAMSESEITTFRGKNISYVFQEYNLIDSLTVEENIELVLDINKIKRRYKTDEILTKVGLLSKKKSFPSELSGWEKQRVALARSFIGETSIILADEPTWSLDSKNAIWVMELLRQLWKDTSCTIIMITHSDEVASYAELHYKLIDKKLITQ